MQHAYMRRFALFFICSLVFLSINAQAGTFTLVDGTKIEGEPVFPVNDGGVLFRTESGEDIPRVKWDLLTQESIRAIMAKATSDRDKVLIAPLIEQLPGERARQQAQRREIVVKPIQPPPRPTTNLGILAIFSSPVGVAILLILYAANLLAAYEVAIYRFQPIAMVCGLAAIPFLGVLSPIIFISMPTRRVYAEGQAPEDTDGEAQRRFRATAPPTDVPAPSVEATAPPPEDQPSEAVPASAPAPVAALPPKPAEPIVFKRGDFLFNRRFFETKLAGFARAVPGQAEKGMVVYIKSSRGEFTGSRIVRYTPTELYLQISRENATADEMIPFIEILEVQIRPKGPA
jgi:hypothetical protein